MEELKKMGSDQENSQSTIGCHRGERRLLYRALGDKAKIDAMSTRPIEFRHTIDTPISKMAQTKHEKNLKLRNASEHLEKIPRQFH
ncbi:hypothetical protein [Variovorax sp. GT1P44]|uniref:hypothetical protein n=1 Tax=Variovorax sp. GT1P44 TaxID=3443742 RepID=UPI003F4612A4